jgi:hypothetical protein
MVSLSFIKGWGNKPGKTTDNQATGNQRLPAGRASRWN